MGSEEEEGDDESENAIAETAPVKSVDPGRLELFFEGIPDPKVVHPLEYTIFDSFIFTIFLWCRISKFWF